ncbi:MAG: IS3 family transposase, partial [Candidatus Falkowbacteria bacterium]
RNQLFNRSDCVQDYWTIIDNAPMESFFGHFKDDVDYKECRTYKELEVLIRDYIEYYNNERYQWDLKKMTPVQYRNHLLMRN